MCLAGQPRHAHGIALDADIHALAAEGQVAQRQRLPARGKNGCIRFDEPLLTNAQTTESVDQALQVSRRAGDDSHYDITNNYGLSLIRFSASCESWIVTAASA
jgi:hypothetical protein